MDVLDAETRSTAIGPLRTPQRRQNTLRAYPADSLQIVEQLPLFRLYLSRRRQMLQGAAAANPEVRAGRRDAIRRGDQNLDQAGFVQLPAPLDQAKTNAFPRQRAVDEDGLAVDARDPPPVMGKIHDVGLLHLTRLQFSGHAAANSLRCGAAESPTSLRTRPTSWACSAEFRCPRKSSKRK